MSATELSASGLIEGVEAQLQRKCDLNSFKDPEVEKAIGSKIEEKIKQGFRYITIIHKVFSPFFFSMETDIEGVRGGFIQENGGGSNIEFYLIERTGEVILLTK